MTSKRVNESVKHLYLHLHFVSVNQRLVIHNPSSHNFVAIIKI